MRHEVNAISEVIEKPAGRSRLLSRLYHEIGLAAVAFELDVEPKELPPETFEAIRRGARYLNFELLDLAS
jgi:hypothetical protein